MFDHFPSREECVLADVLEARARDRPQDAYARFPDSTWTFAEAAERAWAMGNALQRAGVEAGDWVSVWTPTSPELVQTWFGINAAGAIYAPLNLAVRGQILQHMLNLAGARLLVVHGGLAERLQGLDLPHLRELVVIGELPEGLQLPWPVTSFAEFVAGAAGTRPVLETPREPWDDYALIYTSGTTGPSKGVRLSYASNMLYQTGLIWEDIGEDDRYLMAMPLSHVSGTATTFGMLVRGGQIVLPGGFDAKNFWSDVRKHGATMAFVIHAMIIFLLNQPERPDDADNPLRKCYIGPLTRVEEFTKRFGVDVYTGFGMTEIPFALRSELNPKHATTCGRVFDNGFEARLVDEHDLPVPDDTPGEMILRHRFPWVMNSGYKDMPEATATTWRNGWFHTGDMMTRDAAGDFVFVDRTKDAIRRRGENISSYEVEVEVLAHPDVGEVAAIAVMNPDVDESTADQEVMVVVVPAAGASVDPLALTEWLIPRMARHMVPRYIDVVDELPKSPSFKLQKNVLRDRGITPTTWDREAAGIRLKREQLA